MQLTQPILVYSNYCKYSAQFINLLQTNENLLNLFVPLSIDPNKNGKRPEEFYSLQNYLQSLGSGISKVPSILLPSNDGSLIFLEGNDAFKWLESKVVSNGSNSNGSNSNGNSNIEQFENKEVSGINPNEMMSFSDSYAPLNSQLHEGSSQSFQFIDKGFQQIQTYNEDAIPDKNCQAKYEQLLKEREKM